MAAARAAASAADTPGGGAVAIDVGGAREMGTVMAAGAKEEETAATVGAATANDPAGVGGALLTTASDPSAEAFLWAAARSWFWLRLPLRLRLLLWLRERERLRSRRDDRSLLRLRSCRRWDRDPLLREPPRSRLRLLERLWLSERLRRLRPLPRRLPPRLELSVSVLL